MNDIDIVELDDFKKAHIAVLCLPGLESFLSDIVEYLSQDHLVKTFYTNSMSELEVGIEWADLVFIEWCNDLAIQLTQNSKLLEEKKVIIRLHSYEALSGYVQHVRWTVVDCLLFVADHIKEIVLKQMPGLTNPDLNPPDIFVVPNGVRV